MRCLSRIALALGIWLAVAGCAAPGAPAVHPDQNGPVHGESGGGSGGGSM
jgi:hypothetical protein